MSCAGDPRAFRDLRSSSAQGALEAKALGDFWVSGQNELYKELIYKKGSPAKAGYVGHY